MHILQSDFQDVEELKLKIENISTSSIIIMKQHSDQAFTLSLNQCMQYKDTNFGDTPRKNFYKRCWFSIIFDIRFGIGY